MNPQHVDDDALLPSWARPLGLQGYRTFLDLIVSYFDRRNIGIQIDRVEGTVRPDLDAVPLSSVFGLQNIAQACRRTDRDQWTSLIAAHFDSIFDARGDDNALEVDIRDFARVKPRLRARLYPRDVAAHTSEIVCRPGPEGTLEVLALDLLTTVRTVSWSEAEGWGIAPEDLLDIGRRNLRDAGLLNLSPVPLEQGTQLKILSGDAFYAASHLLILDAYMRQEPAHGLLVGIPKRDVLILHEIQNMGVMEAVTAMLQVIVGMHQDGPGSLSPHLYWRRDGETVVLPYEVEDDALTLVPPEEFMTTMDELAEIAELS